MSSDSWKCRRMTNGLYKRKVFIEPLIFIFDNFHCILKNLNLNYNLDLDTPFDIWCCSSKFYNFHCNDIRQITNISWIRTKNLYFLFLIKMVHSALCLIVGLLMDMHNYVQTEVLISGDHLIVAYHK